jgi:diguanylate cyclase (GGDEF)-like protein
MTFMPDDEKNLVNMVIEHFKNLLSAAKAPDILPELAENQDFCQLHDSFLALRELMTNFSRGNVQAPITHRGFVFGALKALQANLEHTIWQIQQVANDDFTQRMTFMGEFATAFNSMVMSLSAAKSDLFAKQQALAKLTESLTEEIHLRSSNLLALRESEEKFKYLAEHDALTGSLNRRSFFARAEIEIQKAFLTRKFCAMAMLDIDFFKKFNDTQGHGAGDAALKHLVNLSAKHLRGSDFMGRYGGEEFIFFFTDAGEKDALTAAERIRQAVESNTFVYEGKNMPMTVSMGVSVVSPLLNSTRNSDFAFAVSKNADGAMYDAKKGGRNRCVIVNMTEFPDASTASADDASTENKDAHAADGYGELGKNTGSETLVVALRALDAAKKYHAPATPAAVVVPAAVAAPAAAEVPAVLEAPAEFADAALSAAVAAAVETALQEQGSGNTDQTVGEADEFAYFKDYE